MFRWLWRFATGALPLALYRGSEAWDYRRQRVDLVQNLDDIGLEEYVLSALYSVWL